MQRSVTQEEIIKFMYGELSFEHTAQLYDAIDSDRDAMEDLEAFAEMKRQLSVIKEKPSSETLERLYNISENWTTV